MSTAITPPSWFNHGPDKRSWFSRPRPLPAASALCRRRRQCLHEATSIHRKFLEPRLLPLRVYTHTCGRPRRVHEALYSARCAATSSTFSLSLSLRGDNKWPATCAPTKRGGRSSKNAYSMDSIHGHFARTIEFLSGSRPCTLRMSKTPDPSLLATLSLRSPLKNPPRSMGRRICLAFGGDPPRGLLPSFRTESIDKKNPRDRRYFCTDFPLSLSLSFSLSTRWNQRRSMSNGSWS